VEHWCASICAATVEVADVAIVSREVLQGISLALTARHDHASACITKAFFHQSEDLLVGVDFAANRVRAVCGTLCADLHKAGFVVVVASKETVDATIVGVDPAFLCPSACLHLSLHFFTACFGNGIHLCLCMSKPGVRPRAAVRK